MIAMMSTGKLAHVPVGAEVGQEIEIWEVVSGRFYKATIVEFPSYCN